MKYIVQRGGKQIYTRRSRRNEVIIFSNQSLLQRCDFILKDYRVLFQERETEAIANMAPGTTPVTESEEDLKIFKSKGAPISLPKHSYWFDFWAFVVFDFVLFLVVYFLVP